MRKFFKKLFNSERIRELENEVKELEQRIVDIENYLAPLRNVIQPAARQEEHMKKIRWLRGYPDQKEKKHG